MYATFPRVFSRHSAVPASSGILATGMPGAAARSRPAVAVCATLSALLLALGGAAALADPTPAPVPGGAYQTSGVSGKLSQVLFNGTIRLRSMSLKDAAPGDKMRPNGATERALVFRAIVSNGTHHEDHGYFDATLVDANGITVTGRPLDDGWSVQPGAAARTIVGFSIPGDFVPVRIVLMEAAHVKDRAFRIALPADALPPAPVPAASQ
ncbi:MAG: hypothetical protein NVSMB64_29140 [Candidatus Velthaea sp.]